jgi:hypothetical protein
MLKRLGLAFAGLFSLATVAMGAGTIPFSLSQQFDKFGHVLAGCKLNIIQAGTVGTPQIAYQDTALTIPVPGGSQLICDASGRIGQFFLADGNVKILLTDANGLTQVTADNILVIGNSSGGGGGSPVDPTTVLATGDIKAVYGTGVLTGFVRLNGRTIGSATSGATERANSDTQPLFQYLWATDPNLVVSTGRGASANADWVANKQITLPDFRDRAIAGLGDMGNADAGLLTATFFGATSVASCLATTLGCAGGLESQRLTATQIPPISTINNNAPNYTLQSGNAIIGSAGMNNSAINTTALVGGGAGLTNFGVTGFININAGTLTSISNNTGGGAHPIVSPLMLVTIYQKL